jgi:hypothetical protein
LTPGRDEAKEIDLSVEERKGKRTRIRRTTGRKKQGIGEKSRGRAKS